MEHDLERILADDYLRDLPARSVVDLRSLRAECQAIEHQLSYVRRLVHGRHDIVSGELDRRRGGGDPTDVHGLVERLPEILADRGSTGGGGRLVASITPPDAAGPFVERLHAIAATVPLATTEAVAEADLVAAAAELAELGNEVSAIRRTLFDRIDLIEVELTRRYADGEARVDDLLADRPD